VINTIPAEGDLSVVAARMPAGDILSEGAYGHWPLSLAGRNRELADAGSPSRGSTPLWSDTTVMLGHHFKLVESPQRPMTGRQAMVSNDRSTLIPALRKATAKGGGWCC